MTYTLQFIKVTKRYWLYEAPADSGIIGKVYIPIADGLPPQTITVEIPQS